MRTEDNRMVVYVIAQSKIENRELLDQYGAKVIPFRIFPRNISNLSRRSEPVTGNEGKLLERIATDEQSALWTHIRGERSPSASRNLGFSASICAAKRPRRAKRDKA
jgi:hypothetical protein